MKKKELGFLVVILLGAAALWVGTHLLHSGTNTSIRITVDGEEYGTYSLSKDQIIPIGTTNVCEIKNGAVRMIEADCPDQLCIHQTPIDATHRGSIICLPNKVIIEGEASQSSGEQPDIDAVT